MTDFGSCVECGVTGGAHFAYCTRKASQEAADKVNHPPHYTAGGIETFDYFEAKSTPEEQRGAWSYNALKYLSRAGKKPDTPALEDYQKALVYVKKLIDLEEKNGPE